MLPRLLDSHSHFLRLLRTTFGLKTPFKGELHANFISDHFVISIDSNSLVPWTAARLCRATQDQKWARKAWPKLEKSMLFYEPLLREGLIHQPPFSDWKDTVGTRRGAVFFTQVLHWKALESMSELASLLGAPGESAVWKKKALAFSSLLNEKFWDEKGGFYRDSLHYPVFSSDGNLGAIVWGLAFREQGLTILESLERLKLNTPWGPRSSQRYPYRQKGWLARLALVHGYQDDYVWLWQSALLLQAYHRLGLEEERNALLQALGERVLAEGEIGEVYRPEDGGQARTWLYRSEAPFSWSSGMLLEALAISG